MAVEPQVTAGGSGSRQRALVLALAGVLLLAFVAVVARPVLLGGSAAQPAPASPRPAVPTSTTLAQLIQPSTSVAGPTAGTAKDPFRPAAAALTTVTTATTTAPTTTTAGDGTATATVSGSGTTAQREVTLEDVFSKSGKRYVKVSVDGTSHTAAEGETFADDFMVLDVGSTCATFESASGRFTLCEGEAVLK
jgi:hypothetical protein